MGEYDEVSFHGGWFVYGLVGNRKILSVGSRRRSEGSGGWR